MQESQGREGDVNDETVEGRGGALRKPTGLPENNPRDKTDDKEQQVAQGDLKWNIVIRIEGGVFVARRAGETVILTTGTPAAFPFGAKHLHPVTDDLGGPAILAVPILPLAGLESSLNVDCFSFGEVLLGNLRLLVPEDDIVPFGSVFPFTTLVFDPVRCSNGKTRHLRTRGGIANLRILTEIADEHYFVETGHDVVFPLLSNLSIYFSLN